MSRYIFSRSTCSKVSLFNKAQSLQRMNNEIRLNSTKSGSSSSSGSDSSGSSGSSSSDDDKRSAEKMKSNEALEKLNKLLRTMIQEDVNATVTKLDMARPSDKRRKSTKREELKSEKSESHDKKLAKAVKNVAESLGGNVEKTESELLTKLLSTADDKSCTNLSEVLKGMKIDQGEAVSDQSKAHQVRQALQARTPNDRTNLEKEKPQRSKSIMTKIDVFGSEPLGIFSPKDTNATEGVENKTWNKLYERHLKLAIIHPPQNYFQQLILWTEQGKIWKFPIDNEQDLHDEKQVYFTEHVFLEKHLEPWCPRTGPLRHFMELVCVGLSKNPYLTAEAKKEHIMWFKNYFAEKEQLLRETGAIQDTELLSGANGTKQIKQ